ncbi:Histidine kinase-, DNA gyrase B-, and HSP90-like ATPase [Catalinimonas alkaloidigena]|uniref:histidine kinase n=1 Tax=Catalinimonas alkaloidigena TaxID=1075417 RepID=A0A1G9N940_9BACT|nr:ATP-binding protein [Catalinimonas alkaloidigena]SDL82999.1 Histidine kinase-, DNA gyrase B-, and HSP90-like ATPase [Catalinimonas alkaloidigena]
MQYDQSEIVFIILTSVILSLLLGGFIVFFFFAYQRRYVQHQKELTQLREEYQRELLKVQLEVQERTMGTIAQELHDNIGQLLALTKLHLFSVPVEPEAPAAQKLTSLRELVNQVIKEVRNLSHSLNTEHLRQQSLSQALQRELALIGKSGLFETHFQLEGNEQPIDPSRQLVAFRIVQETLQNMLKHAEGKSVSIALQYHNEQLAIRVADDGRGFEVDTLRKSGQGSGLNNMYYRAKMIDATFRIESSPGQGTTTYLTMPLVSAVAASPQEAMV